MLASLEDRELLMERVQTIVQERERLSRGLGALEFVEVYPSQANFVLARLKPGLQEGEAGLRGGEEGLDAREGEEGLDARGGEDGPDAPRRGPVRARAVYDQLAQRGIFVRYFDTLRLRDCLRISVGLPSHTDRLLEAMQELGGERGR